jgi:hypothetical protein
MATKKKYENIVRQIHPRDVRDGSPAIEAWLNEMQQHGWRLVAALPTGNPNAPVGSYFVFEREV